MASLCMSVNQQTKQPFDRSTDRQVESEEINLVASFPEPRGSLIPVSHFPCFRLRHFRLFGPTTTTPTILLPPTDPERIGSHSFRQAINFARLSVARYHGTHLLAIY